MIVRDAGIVDTISVATLRDSAVVMPTLEYAIYWWPILGQAFRDYHGEVAINQTRTAIISKRSRTILRLWVPYNLDATMPMDFPHAFKYSCDYIDFYGRMGHFDYP